MDIANQDGSHFVYALMILVCFAAIQGCTLRIQAQDTELHKDIEINVDFGQAAQEFDGHSGVMNVLLFPADDEQPILAWRVRLTNENPVRLTTPYPGTLVGQVESSAAFPYAGAIDKTIDDADFHSQGPLPLTLHLTQEDFASIEGALIAKATQEPISQQKIVLHRIVPFSGSLPVSSVVTDGSGRFSFDFEAAGQFELSLAANERFPAHISFQHPISLEETSGELIWEVDVP